LRHVEDRRWRAQSRDLVAVENFACNNDRIIGIDAAWCGGSCGGLAGSCADRGSIRVNNSAVLRGGRDSQRGGGCEQGKTDGGIMDGRSSLKGVLSEAYPMAPPERRYCE
jgi:hypothetical protein